MNAPAPRSSSQTGLGEWLLQRLSALYVAGFSVYAAAHLLMSPPVDFLAWRAWFGSGPVRLAWALFFVLVFVHAWIGMRSVFMDYLHPLWLRLSALALTAMGLLALALWAGQILLGVAP
jgi:succinate dehydrogenase / fumarate reductase membrane anchor subunit